MIVRLSGENRLISTFSSEVFETHLKEATQDMQSIELLDGNGNILSCNGNLNLTGLVRSVNSNHLEPSREHLSDMMRWSNSYWEETTSFMKGSDWTIRVATPMKDMVYTLQKFYIKSLLVMLFISIAAMTFLLFFIHTVPWEVERTRPQMRT
ncbi:MAG: hypothetical protein AAED33_03135 [Paracoccaceae bacterium]|jgi:hypothetical protein